MKIDIFEDVLTLYLFSENLNLDSKIELIKQLKNILEKIINCYKIELSGAYEAVVYENKYYGYIIDFYKIREFEYGNYIDLKLEIKLNQTFYFVTDNFNFICSCDNVFLKNDNYFVNINELKNVNVAFEYGEIIYKNCDKLLDKCVKINKKNVN